jgi:multimeric flavodoxin WrbA
MGKKIVGIVGSYRKGGIIDSAVSAVLKGAENKGCETKRIYLVDKHIEFCKNCRSCVQEETCETRGKCIQNDDMAEMLQEIDNADGVVLGAPINFFNVTALMKKFIERLLPYSYWPWGRTIPRYRIKRRKINKKVVTVTSSGCPAWLGRIIFSGALSILKAAARCIGARVVKSLYFGMVRRNENSQLSERELLKAYKAGEKLAS